MRLLYSRSTGLHGLVKAVLLCCSFGFSNSLEFAELTGLPQGHPIAELIGTKDSVLWLETISRQSANGAERPPPVVLLPSTVLHQFPLSQGTASNLVPVVSPIAPPSSNVAQDESVPAGTTTQRPLLGIPWLALVQRPLTDQSISGNNGPFGGAVSNGITVVQQGFSQLGSSIQNGLNGAFAAGVNQPNQGTIASLAPSMPLVSINFGNVSTFCPATCNMACGRTQTASARQARIVGGADVKPANKYPWLALLQYYEQNTGTGTLINDRTVITTATIVSRMVVFRQIRVIFGAFDANVSGEKTRRSFPVAKGRIHPQYSADSPLRNNIGLLQLAVPVLITDQLMPICMPDNVDSYGDSSGVIAGWGAQKLDGMSWRTLQEAPLPLLSYDECRLAYPSSTESNLCGGVFNPAPENRHQTTCDGDDGVGLMYPSAADPTVMTLIGVALQSPGSGCGRNNQPAVFTKFFQFIPWAQTQSPGCYCKS